MRSYGDLRIFCLRSAGGRALQVVVAYVGEMGSQNPKYADYRKYAKPFEFAWMNMYNGPAATSVDWAVRQQEIPWGEEAMFENFQRAIQAYDWGYDIPNQPPNIRLSFESNLDGQAEISWSACTEDAVDPDYEGDEAKDIRGYRIYRSKTENQGPYELAVEFSVEAARSGTLPRGVSFDPNRVFRTIKNTAFPEGIPLRENPLLRGMDAGAGAEVKGLYTYTDRDSKAGFPFWYTVRAYDSGHDDWKGQGPVPALSFC